jgi:nudix-type nucleoside diphosphatase (YffH/AdpP family)
LGNLSTCFRLWTMLAPYFSPEFDMNNVKILKEKTAFNKKLVIEEGKISINKKKVSRERVLREDAAAVLVYNSETKKVILTKQFRFAIASKIREDILEIVAGKIEGGKSAEETAIKEVEEETGYKPRKENLKFLLSCFSTPGYSSECFHVYYAKVTNADKVSEGGGLKEESEFIQVIELELEDFRSRIQKAEIKDAKTYLAALYLFSYGGTDY